MSSTEFDHFLNIKISYNFNNMYNNRFNSEYFNNLI